MHQCGPTAQVLSFEKPKHLVEHNLRFSCRIYTNCIRQFILMQIVPFIFVICEILNGHLVKIWVLCPRNKASDTKLIWTFQQKNLELNISEGVSKLPHIVPCHRMTHILIQNEAGSIVKVTMCK